MKTKSNHPQHQVNFIRDLLKLCNRHKVSISSITGNLTNVAFERDKHNTLILGTINANSVTTIDKETNQTKHNFHPNHAYIIGHS